MTRHNKALGDWGEDRTVAWYLDRGFEVVARNWRCRSGEIDVVVQRQALLVFCEVKTRSSSRFGSALEAVTPAKQAKLRALAMEFLRSNSFGYCDLRFDVASVMGAELVVIEGIF